MLRVNGVGFDVDEYLRRSQLLPLRVWREGEPRTVRSKPSLTSGFSAEVSDADFSNLDSQIQEAAEFLVQQHPALTLLASSLGVQDVVLDFGIEDRDVLAQADVFPHGCSLAGSLNIGLMVSRYSRSENEAASQD
ncbi:hypothetical protein [Deinococcus sp.]|uniref:hypothetical protein n=1 Tax=Deinococcus sp. TaxID=47478 RepID=UPI003C7C10D0